MFVDVKRVWSFKREQQSSLALDLVQVMATIIDPREIVDSEHGEICYCMPSGWHAFGLALAYCKDPPGETVRCVSEHDWKAIFDSPRNEVGGDVPLDEMKTNCCEGLRQRAVHALKEDQSNVAASKVLRGLGSCHDYFRRVMNACLNLSSLPTVAEVKSELSRLVQFLDVYLHCIVAPPDDPELDDLVQHAHRVLLEISSLVLGEGALQEAGIEPFSDMKKIQMERVVSLLQQWETLKCQDDETRQQRFEDAWLQPDSHNAETWAAMTKQSRKIGRKKLRKKINLSDGEMCANCTKLESDLGCKLVRCGKCKQTKYCSKECQVQHWKKAHRKQCKMPSK